MAGKWGGGGGGGEGGVEYTHFTQAHTSVKPQVSLMYQDTICWSKHAHKNYNMQHHILRSRDHN